RRYLFVALIMNPSVMRVFAGYSLSMPDPGLFQADSERAARLRAIRRTGPDTCFRARLTSLPSSKPSSKPSKAKRRRRFDEQSTASNTLGHRPLGVRHSRNLFPRRGKGLTSPIGQPRRYSFRGMRFILRIQIPPRDARTE